MGQQAEASTLGMWVFLVTEIMFFGGLFMAYLVYRHAAPEGFQEASHELNRFWAQTSAKRGTQVFFLGLTMFLGLVFLGIKAIEYTDKFVHHHVPGPHFHWDGQYPKPAEQFYSLYFAMTGLHAVHMIVGVGIMAVITWMAWRETFDEDYYTPVEVAGLYWHFVDIVWIFIYPCLYLVARS
ncbi:MAG: cytochrome oxidase subunit III [Acidobacteria bacterium]|nr:MAG: cytochrome oxidase subunit III [Acidobacteriota bacterium]